MTKKYKIVALFGEGGSGKDTILNWIVSNIPKTKKIINHTTRPKRDNEINEKDYYFVTPDEFAEKIFYNKMLEATVFNYNFYGTSIETLDKDKINIGVLNPTGIECLLQDERVEVLPIYIKVKDKIKLERMLEREKEPDCKEVCRRFLSDKKDFEYIDFDYSIYDNSKNRSKFYGIIHLINKKTRWLNQD